LKNESGALKNEFRETDRVGQHNGIDDRLVFTRQKVDEFTAAGDNIE
jgi:hypothetical protein